MLKKPLIYFSWLIIVLSLLMACSKSPRDEASFTGIVLEIGDNYLMVEPAAGSKELTSTDKIMVFIGENTQLGSEKNSRDITLEDMSEGNRVEIFYSGEIATSYPGQINNPFKIVLLEDYIFIASDENFLIKTYIEKLQFTEGEEISLYTTLEYVGEKISIEIWSGEPYFHHMIEKDGKIFSGGLTLDVLKKTVLKKGEIYTIPFSKSGGYSEDDPDADFWRSFYSEKALKLPKGEYTFSAVTSFTLDEAQQEKVQLKNEFIVEVK